MENKTSIPVIERKWSSLAIIGFIFSLVSLIFLFLLPSVSFILGLIGGVLGLISIKKIKQNKEKGKGFTVFSFGIALSFVIYLIYSIIVVVLLFR